MRTERCKTSWKYFARALSMYGHTDWRMRQCVAGTDSGLRQLPWTRRRPIVTCIKRDPNVVEFCVPCQSSPVSTVQLFISLQMDNEAYVDPYVDNSGRSSPAASSDSDAVNTSNARVYFGPVQSAEKQRAQRVNVGQPTPVRRSARISSVAPLQIGGDNTKEARTGGDSNQSSRSETPALAEDLLEGAYA